MSLQPTFSLDELLAELERQDSHLEGYRTAREWADCLGVFDSKMLDLLRAASRQGKLLTAKEQRPSIDGSRRYVPVYAFRVGE